MIPLSSATSSRYTFSKFSCNGSEIKAGEQVVGTLRRPSVWSFRFEAETPHGSWVFRRRGFTGIEIVDARTQQSIATFKPEWGTQGRGTLTFADGQTFLMRCKGWWRQVWTLTNASGQPVISLDTGEKSVETHLESLVDQGNARDTRLSLLILFTLYRIRQAEEDAASAVLVAAIS